MRRFVLQIVAMVVLLLSQLSAQILGSRDTRPPDNPATKLPNAQAQTDPFKGMHRAIAVQAFGTQPTRFLMLTKNTGIALKQTEVFQQQVAELATSKDCYRQATVLELAIEDTQFSMGDFLRSFSGIQRIGLKKHVEKLWKSDNDIGKELKSIQQELKRPDPDSKRLTNLADKLSRSLAKFRSEQLLIGAEMGIEKPS